MVSVERASVYLDWAATTPLCGESLDAMRSFFSVGNDNISINANANSLHTFGRDAFKALEEARKSFAHDIGASRSSEVIFTSGATEADNAALFGVVAATKKKATQQGKRDFIPHIIVSKIEHDAILAPAKILKSYGCELDYIKPNKEGFVDPDVLQDMLKPHTVLVSVHAANNEIGTIQPIEALAEITHKNGSFFHTDAAQLLGKQVFNLKNTNIDAASFSAHKICGPKGVGALYLRKSTPFDPLIVGGGQESGLRSGTQNVCGVCGFAAASRAAHAMLDDEVERLRGLRDYLYERATSLSKVKATIPVEEGSGRHLPNLASLMVSGFESETLILRLDMKGFAISGGSACSSHSLEPSHVITSLGYKGNEAQGSLRISMGRYTTKEEVEAFIEALSECIV